MPPAYTLSIAPMMGYTDRHFRYLLRLITRKTLLYSEMIHANALIHGHPDRYISFSKDELPVVLQLGGNDPESLSKAAAIGEGFGYSEINLNVGCPSDKVQTGNFGACLMANPSLVASLVEAMKQSVSIPVTVKHRIGINGKETYEDLLHFARAVKRAGADRLIVHARIAVLGGLSPAENREIPPLRYDEVYQLKKDLPGIPVEINGGIRTLSQAKEHLAFTDGVMMGRAAVEDPWLFARADKEIFNTAYSPTRRMVIEKYLEYMESQQGHPLSAAKHILSLFPGIQGSRNFRRHISENIVRDKAPVEVVRKALEFIPPEILDAV